jgi:NhaA family Na+:H+ antiporter
MTNPTPIDALLRPIERYMHEESTAGILLFISTILALIWANSPWSADYFHLWETHLSVHLGPYNIDKALHSWINDGLMAMFFFVVGLELKREVMAGELSSPKKALLPFVAALGGMVGPALIFISINRQLPEIRGWGIPMATDIAFALGIVSLLGKRVPVSLKIFITALAIADDLGAVLVIAFFYTSDVSLLNLGSGLVYLIILIGANLLGIRSSLFYGLVGIGGVWLAFLLSGVHATIAGVLAALTIPARAKIDEVKFIQRLEFLIRDFRNIPPNDVTLLEPAQHEVVTKINKLTKAAATPLQRLEHRLHPWVAFIVMPIFAFANAGVEFSYDMFGGIFFQTVTLGVIAGLVAGKFIGVVATCWVMKKTGLADLPEGMGWPHIFGIGFLAGIGFTMSLFITNLAFKDEILIQEAKIGIFIASIIAGTAAYFILKSSKSKG